MFWQQLINGLSLGSLYALLAIGFSLICGILNMITFAHGEVYMLGAFAGLYIIAALNASLEISIVAALIASILTAGILGFLTERLAFRPFRDQSALCPALITIGLSIVLQSIVLLVAGADTKPFPFNITTYRIVLGNTVISGIEIFIIALNIFLMLLLHLFIHNTRWGLALRAASSSIGTADIMGIDTNKIIAIAFALASVLAGIDGLLAGAYYGAFYPRMGVTISIKALAGATFGGINNVRGAVVGAMTLGIVETFAVGYVSASYRDVIAFTILILVLLIKPSGLLGTIKEEKV